MRIVESKKLPDDFFRYQEAEDIVEVKSIISDVKTKGDSAIRKYTEKYDRLKIREFELSKKDIKKAYSLVGKKTVLELKNAAKNISFFAEMQLKQFKPFKIRKNGGIIGQKIIPLERVGCYVPGGRYPLPSSALMTVIPAKVAGVKEIILCSPKIQPATIVAADIAGADRIFCIGGVQAIAAMAYGTRTVPKVDKIMGPGNKYVTAAKKEVYGVVGIDFLAGPSEIMIIADGSADAKLIAADMLAQAEHDTGARADLVTTSRKLAFDVRKEIGSQIKMLGTRKIAEISLKGSWLVVADDLDEAIRIANRRAPEHLELQIGDASGIIAKLRNYGSLFVGRYSAEVFGDYCSGTNHTLPTNGAARYTGGLSVRDFVKVLTYQKISKQACSKLCETATELAGIEGLDGHKKSAVLRTGI